jgi:uncharacterized protein (DUF2062 family)
MLFRRRTKPSFSERVRIALWPSNGWSRSLRYFAKRVVRLSGSPHAVALGFATGVFISWTPFVGFHILMGIALAFVFGGNLVAAGLGTVVGNPLTFPLMWWSSFSLGNRMLAEGGGEETDLADVAHAITHEPLEGILPLIKPLTVGSLPLGIASAILSYAFVYLAVRAYQNARRHRLAARRIAVATPALPPPAETRHLESA